MVSEVINDLLYISAKLPSILFKSVLMEVNDWSIIAKLVSISVKTTSAYFGCQYQFFHYC